MKPATLRKLQAIRLALTAGPLTALTIAQQTGIDSNTVRMLLKANDDFVIVDQVREAKQKPANRWSLTKKEL